MAQSKQKKENTSETRLKNGLLLYQQNQFHAALIQFEFSANAGNLLACIALGLIYKAGIKNIIPCNSELSESYLEKIKEHKGKILKKTSREAYYLLGVCHAEGFFLKKDTNKAFRYFYRSADKNFAPAQYRLARCYMGGLDMSPDFQKAVELLQKATAQGHIEADILLGVCYEKGLGIEKDTKMAVTIYEKRQDHNSAKRNLGICYEQGLGLSKNLTKA